MPPENNLREIVLLACIQQASKSVNCLQDMLHLQRTTENERPASASPAKQPANVKVGQDHTAKSCLQAPENYIINYIMKICTHPANSGPALCVARCYKTLWTTQHAVSISNKDATHVLTRPAA